jgi:murein L,D-transpeptidase YcbB/YkuD
MRVVVGRSLDNRTPIFVQQMEYVVFRPYWNPPYGIAAKEIVPHARRDPSYLEREDLEIVASGDEGALALPATPDNLDAVVAGRLFVRQRPGPRNSLGLAKFISAAGTCMQHAGDAALRGRAATSATLHPAEDAATRQWVLRDVPG